MNASNIEPAALMDICEGDTGNYIPIRRRFHKFTIR